MREGGRVPGSGACRQRWLSVPLGTSKRPGRGRVQKDPRHIRIPRSILRSLTPDASEAQIFTSFDLFPASLRSCRKFCPCFLWLGKILFAREGGGGGRAPAIRYPARILAVLAVVLDRHPYTIPDLAVSVLCGKWMPHLPSIAQVGTALIPQAPDCELKAAGFDPTADDVLA